MVTPQFRSVVELILNDDNPAAECIRVYCAEMSLKTGTDFADVVDKLMRICILGAFKEKTTIPDFLAKMVTAEGEIRELQQKLFADCFNELETIVSTPLFKVAAVYCAVILGVFPERN